MRLEELKQYASMGVFLTISAADLLQVLESMVAGNKLQQQGDNSADLRPYTMQEACKEYGKSEKTLKRWVADGLLLGEKKGARWEFENRHARVARLNNAGVSAI